MNCQHTASAGRRYKEQLFVNATYNPRAARRFSFFLSFTPFFVPFLSTFFLSAPLTVYF
jgi:hypothetical protein